MRNSTKIKQLIHQASDKPSPDLLIVILGPTASGKTKLAVELAEQLDGEIISADSRQVYRHMDIGTGKDLHEYGDVSHHLIGIRAPGDNYNVDSYRDDFFEAYDSIVQRGKQAILCGGSGSYIQAVLQERPYAQIPKNKDLQLQLSNLSKEELLSRIDSLGAPADLQIDITNHKRLVRALEILLYLEKNGRDLKPQRIVRKALLFGLGPSVHERRLSITNRLSDRLEQGLIEEVAGLIKNGLSYESLIYYGLEYKYVAYYLQGRMAYEEMLRKLGTEIHRYAKRQMTYFRKMEKDGLQIHWL